MKGKADDPSALHVVLFQEIERYNLLLHSVRTSCTELQKGIKGLVVMSADLDSVFDALYGAKVRSISVETLEQEQTEGRDGKKQNMLVVPWKSGACCCDPDGVFDCCGESHWKVAKTYTGTAMMAQWRDLALVNTPCRDHHQSSADSTDHRTWRPTVRQPRTYSPCSQSFHISAGPCRTWLRLSWPSIQTPVPFPEVRVCFTPKAHPAPQSLFTPPFTGPRRLAEDLPLPEAARPLDP